MNELLWPIWNVYNKEISIFNAEKGAHFRGDSYIVAHYAQSLSLNEIKVQLAFSTTAVRNTAQALLLIQTSKV